MRRHRPSPPGGSLLNFCLVTIFYPPYSFGGDAIFVRRLAGELARRGHSVDVVRCADSFRLYKSRPGLGKFFDAPGVTVHAAESVFGPLAPLAAHQTGRPLLNGARVAGLLRSKAFDVVHFHNVSLFGPGVLELPAAGDPVRLYTAHDHWLVCPLSTLWKFGSTVCERPSCVRCAIRAGRPPQWWRGTGLLRRAAAKVDRFLAPSEATVRSHRERGFAGQFEVLPPFVDDPADDAPGPPPHPRPYFLFAGRLEKYKGAQDLLDAFRGPGDWDLLIAGEGTYEAELRARAAGAARVRFLGWVAEADLGPYYRHAVATLAPSLTHETFGLVVAESMARGTPVVARDLGALPESVAASGGGLVFSSQAELSERVERLGRDERLRGDLGEAGRRFAAERWTAEAHLRRYFGIVEQVRAERRR